MIGSMDANVTRFSEVKRMIQKTLSY